MKRKKFTDQLKHKIATSDPERLNGYIEMFDRLLLYNMATFMLPPEAIENLLEQWKQIIKSTINTESCMRTHFLESMPQGRLAKKDNQPDGEALRLLFLDTLSTAKQIVARNLQRDEDGIDFESNSEF